ncbi:alginate O-acetyltransferase AlgX-related protein [Methylobacterium oryzihabitans]|nr:hypothetical protein [Methylobacterium oryzihabitans]
MTAAEVVRPAFDVAGPQEAGGEAAMVHAGRDGWLFLVGGSNDVLGQYRHSWAAWRQTWGWRRLLARRARRFRQLGIAYRHLVVPEKLTVLDDRLDGLALDAAAAPAVRLRRALRLTPAAGCLVDLVGPLRAARETGDLYLRTDTHWSHDGCFVAYAALCRHLGTAPREDLRDGCAASEIEVCGDLGLKLRPWRWEALRVRAIRRDAVLSETNALVRDFEAAGRGLDLHLGARAVFRNPTPGADPRRLVVFGDSCAHFRWDVRTGMLTGLLAETFAEVHFLWSTGIDWDYVAAVRPDVVITEIAERFMAELPPFGYSHARLEETVRARKDLG